MGVGWLRAKAGMVKRAASKKIKQQGISEEEAEEYLSDPPDSESISKPKNNGKPCKLEAPAPPFAPRTPSLPYLLGAHVSIAKGPPTTRPYRRQFPRSLLRSQRKWASPELPSTSITEFKALAVQRGYNRKHILPQPSYLINLAQKTQRNINSLTTPSSMI